MHCRFFFFCSFLSFFLCGLANEVQFVVSHQVELSPGAAAGVASTPKVVTIFQNGGNNTRSKIGVDLVVDHATFSEFAKAALLAAYSQIDENLPFKIFDKFRQQKTSLEEIEDKSTLYVVKGEDHFFWPGHFVGHSLPLLHVDSGIEGKTLNLITLALEPRVFLIPQFITDSESDAIRGIGEPLMRPSHSIIDGVDKPEAARNSNTAWLGREHPVIFTLDKRVAQVIGIPHDAGHDELTQVLRYLPYQHYYGHTDFFKPEFFVHQGVPKTNNRLLTLLYYLNTPEEGGETAFFCVEGYPGYGKTYENLNVSDCSSAFRVKPMKGDAVLFYNLNVDYHMDPVPLGDEASLHAGCDVIRGVKWAANKWVWNRPYHVPQHNIN